MRSSRPAGAWQRPCCGAAAPASRAPWPGPARSRGDVRTQSPAADADRQRSCRFARAQHEALAAYGRGSGRPARRGPVENAGGGCRRGDRPRRSSAAMRWPCPQRSPEAARQVLAETFALVAERMPRPGSLFVTGGETLHGLLQALGCGIAARDRRTVAGRAACAHRRRPLARSAGDLEIRRLRRARPLDPARRIGHALAP